MRKLFVRYAKADSGATAIEYGLILAGIGVAIVTIIGDVGTGLGNLFSDAPSYLR